MKAELVPENGDPPIPITRDITVVGRREYCDVRIDDPSLSKRHCVLVKTDGLLVVRDLATTNGTKVKGQRVRWAALLPDDRLTFGAYKLRVYLGPDHVPAPSERPRAAVKARPTPVPTPAAAPAVPMRVPPLPVAPPSDPGFPVPSPLGVPVAGVDDFEILDDGPESGDSGWRQLIPTARHGDGADVGDDLLIELD